MSTVPGVEGFPLGGRRARARELAARDGTDEDTVARLRAELADAQARALAAEDQVRILMALLEAVGVDPAKRTG